MLNEVSSDIYRVISEIHIILTSMYSGETIQNYRYGKLDTTSATRLVFTSATRLVFTAIILCGYQKKM